MNTIQKICSGLLLIIIMASCEKTTNDNIDFVNTGKPISDFSFSVSVSPSGVATITPIASGVSSFLVYFGDNTPNPAKVELGSSATNTYNDGTFIIKVVARNLTGDSLVSTRSITVSTSQTLVDFETPATNFPGNGFGGAVFTRIANPFSGGINTSANVGRIVKGPPETWAGITINPANRFTFGNRGIIRMKVYAPRVGAIYLFKLENPSSGATEEKQVVTTVANAWQELTFVMDPSVNGRSFGGFSVFFEFGLAGNGSANFTGLFDDVKIFP